MEITVFGSVQKVNFLWSDDGLVACASSYTVEEAIARKGGLAPMDVVGEEWGIGLDVPSALADWIWKNRHFMRGDEP